MRKITITQLQSTALIKASKEYAFGLWLARDWSWFDLMRELIYLAADRNLPISKRAQEFTTFVETWIRPFAKAGRDERALFLAPPSEALAEHLAANMRLLQIDIDGVLTPLF